MQKNNLVFTRYADDITISSTDKLNKDKIQKIHYIINQILEDEGFKLNEDKTHCFCEGQCMKVTGVLINNGVMKPDKKILKEIDDALYYISKYGLKSHLEKINSVSDNYIEHLLGIISFINMVNKDIGKNLMERFKKISKEKFE